MDFAKRRDPCMQHASTIEYEGFKANSVQTQISSHRGWQASLRQLRFHNPVISRKVMMLDTEHERLRGELALVLKIASGFQVCAYSGIRMCAVGA